MRIDEALAVPVVAGGKSRRGQQNEAPAGARTAVVAPSRHASAVCAMLATVRDGALYEEIRKAGLQNHVWQWQSFAAFSQYRRVFEATRRYLAPGAVALDWGCGNGHFSFFLVRHGVRSVGYSFESAPPLLAGEPRFEHRRGDPREPVKLPFDDHAFDLVFSIGVLEHVHEAGGNARGSILELERVLKPGGHFLCFHLPNRYAWGENLRKVLKRLGAAEEFHPVLYTSRSFADLLRATTFEIVEAWRYSWLPRNRLSRLPAFVSEASAGVAILNSIDAGLERALSPFCQNWAFVLRKRPVSKER
jgi:SAM-dependent methyltransferase